MQNMRRLLTKPTLRMLDGGAVDPAAMQASRDRAQQALSIGNSAEKYSPMMAMPAFQEPARIGLSLRDGGMFDGIKRAVGMGPAETVTEKYARQDAELAARAPKPVAATPAPAPGAGISGYAGNGALEGRLKAAGLRDGGDLRTGQGGNVPGSGSGDKIPAKYEPGEFVVSNAMLDAEPGLREQLHDLRGNVLAQQGKSVAEADAKAVTGGGLRAVMGLDPMTGERYPGAVRSPLTGNALPPFNPTTSPGAAAPNNNINFSTPPEPLRATTSPGAAPPAPRFDPDPAAVQARTGAAFDARMGQIAGARAAANQATGAATALSEAGHAAGAAVGAHEAAAPSLRTPAGPAPGQGWAMAKDVGKSLMMGAAGYGAARSMAGIGKDNTQGTNVETRDNVNAIPTGGNMPAPGAQPYSWWKDTELGRNVGNTMNAVGPAIGAVGGLLRAGTTSARLANTGAAVAGGMGAGAAMPTEAGTPSSGVRPTAPAAPTFSAGDATMPGQDPGRVTLRGMAGTAVPGAPEISKFTQGGKTLYSNVGGGDNDKLMAGGAGVSTVPGMSKEQIAQVMTNPDGSRWSAGDNAIMAANLRDGVDAYRGTSRDENANGGSLMSRIAKQGPNTAVKSLLAMQQNKAAMYGHDVAREGHALTTGASLRNNAENNRVAELKALQDGRQSDRTYNLAAGTQAQALGEKFRENAKKEFTVYGADGKTDGQGSQQSFDAVRQIFPGIESADEGTRNKAMADAKEMHGIFNKARTQDKVGWDALKIWEPKRPGLSAMPNAQGAQTEQTNFLSGLVTLGASNGDTLLKNKDGTSLNLGKLTARQLELLNTAKKTGWGT